MSAELCIYVQDYTPEKLRSKLQQTHESVSHQYPNFGKQVEQKNEVQPGFFFKHHNDRQITTSAFQMYS